MESNFSESEDSNPNLVAPCRNRSHRRTQGCEREWGSSNM